MHENIERLFDLSGKVALVTGAGSGIGKAIAEAMGEAGAKVACADINLEAAQITASYIKQAGSSAIGIICDVSKEEDVQEMMKQCLERFGQLDILFNVAGIPHFPAKLHEFPRKDWDRIIAVNLTGTYLCCREALKIMVKQRSGKIVNMSSTIGERGSKSGNAPGMCATKGAVTVLTKELAIAYAEYGIHVNALAPGSIKTNISAQLFKELSYEEASERIFKALEADIPLKRVGLPGDLKGAAVFLAGKGSDYITGHVLAVDGGKLAR